MISLKQIKYALAVEKTKHFREAAELCSVSQSTLSTGVSEFEKQLGLQIFERDNKQVLITPVGRDILNRARKVQIEIDDLYQFSKVYKVSLSYPLSLGIIPTIGPYLLPIVLPQVRKQYPDFQVILEESQSKILVNKVKNGELDAAIIALPFDTEGLHCFEFWQEDFYIISHKSDDSISKDEIASDELDKSKLLLLQDGHCLKDHALAACAFKRSQIDASFSGTSLYTLIQMVSTKMGTTFVPQMALKQLLHNNSELKVSHLNEPSPHRKIAFITRLNFNRVNDIELLKTIFKQQLAK